VFRRLVSRNSDLARLVERGYAVAFDSNHLVVRDVPYLDSAGALAQGTLVTKLEFIDAERVRQTDHQVFFAGSVPHRLDGSPIPNLGGGPTTLALSSACTDVVVQRSFSNKPPSGRFEDFFAKIESYVTIISGPAMEKFGVSPRTRRVVMDDADGSVFTFPDTLTSRGEITELSARLAQETVAIIGLGGSGAFLLDFLAKTPVREIRAFDHDIFCVHNAYRSPGRLDPAELGAPKAHVHLRRYDNFRSNLTIEQKFIDRSSTAELDGVTFAFVCVDRGTARAEIFDLLIDRGIPFIDVGLGLDNKRGALSGMVRVTYYSTDDARRVRDEGWAELADRDDDIYDQNVQIAELNALNAALAVIKFKQVRGFYYEVDHAYHLLFDIADLRIVAQTHGDAD
jgi:hypothetical protein